MRLYSKAQLSVRHAASTDATRENLNGVHFDAEGRTVASNGHILFRVTVPPPPSIEEFPQVDGEKMEAGTVTPFTLPLPAVEELRKAIPKAHMPILEHAVLDTKRSDVASRSVYFFATDLERTRRVEAKKIYGEFPNVDPIFAEGAKRPYAFTCDLRLLEKVIKAAGELADNCKGALHAQFYADGPLDTLRITFADRDNGELDAIVCTMRDPAHPAPPTMTFETIGAY